MNNCKIKNLTIYDISQEAGVSIATVSRVINGSKNVSAKTREKVLGIMSEYDFEPNLFARGLGTGSIKTIGILCADVADLYLANAVSFLERELKANGFDSVLYCTGFEHESKVRGLKTIESRHVDAVIMVGSHYVENINKKNNYIRETSKRIPIMMLNGYIDGENVCCAMSEDKIAFNSATNKLIESGCNNILFLYREDTYSKEEKLAGYLDALNSNDLGDKKNLLQVNSKIQVIKDKVSDTLKKETNIDAILACDDELAIGAIKGAKAAGKDVPKEIQIIGCNNSALSICCEPELTTVDNMCEAMCISIVTLLVRTLEHQVMPKKVMISCNLIERGTTRLR